MNNLNPADLIKLLKPNYTAHQRVLTQDILEGYWMPALEDYPFEAIALAYKKAIKATRFLLTPNDLIDHLPDMSGHPTPEVAWQLCPKLDTDGGYVTDEIMMARSTCDAAIEAGDRMARMAFLESYKQILVSAKLSGLRPKIWYSAPDSGDFEGKKRLKIQKTLEAVNLGLVGQERANETITAICGEIGQDAAHYLPHLKPNLQLVDRSNQKKIMQDIMKVLK